MLFLYGSQARDEARPDSDWDILILLDKLKIEVEDYDNVSYPLVELGWSLNECVSPVLYTLKDWMRYQRIKAQTHNGVVGQLGLNYVSKGLLTKDEGRLYSRLLQHRITGDYNDLIIL